MTADAKHRPRKRPHSGPRAPVRVMQIMEQLGVAPHGLALGRLAEKLGTPKTTLLSFLRVLESANYVRNVEGVYRIAELGMRLGTIISNANPFPGLLRDALVRLMEESGETTLLAVLAEGRTAISYVDMVESRSAIRFSATIGAQRPLHCTAAGTALLAAQTDEWVDRFLKTSVLKGYTKNTIIKASALRSEIAKIRRAGVSETHEHYSSGVSGFGAVVYDVRSKPIAAVVIAAPTSRAKLERNRLMYCARRAATEMSHILGAGASRL